MYVDYECFAQAMISSMVTFSDLLYDTSLSLLTCSPLGDICNFIKSAITQIALGVQAVAEKVRSGHGAVVLKHLCHLIL